MNFIYSIVLFFILSIQSLALALTKHEIEIKILAQSLFANKPGFGVIANSKVSGHIFEMESALWVMTRYNQTIKGFDLSLDFFDENDKKIDQLSTEFDVITDKYAIECKSAKKPAKHGSNILYQARKEHSTLSLFQNIYKEIFLAKFLGKISTIQHNDDFIFDVSNNMTLVVSRRHKLHSTLTVRGSIVDKPLTIQCNWIQHSTSQQEAKEWMELIKTLGSCYFIIFFGGKVSETFALKLNDGKTEKPKNDINFFYNDEIKLDKQDFAKLANNAIGTASTVN